LLASVARRSRRGRPKTDIAKSSSLIPASGDQDHAISLVRTSTARLATPARPSHPVSHVGDDWPNAPPGGLRTRGYKHSFLKNGSLIFARPAENSNQPESACEIGFLARTILARRVGQAFAGSSNLFRRATSQIDARTRGRNIRVAVGALSPASAARFRHSTRRGIGPYATAPSRCDASPSTSTLSR
jgi:hypothetical protein